MVDPLNALLVAFAILAVIALIFWPKKGLLARRQRMKHLNSRVCGENALKHIHKFELSGRAASLESVAGALNMSADQAADILATLQADHLLTISDNAIQLTPDGREVALHIIRAHRLWEQHLAEETGYAEADWHTIAEQYEHSLTPQDADKLAARLGHPIHDPHGDPIPTAQGTMVDRKGQPIADLPLDATGVIVHLEDEPPMIYEQLMAEGLHPGMMVHVTEVSPQRVRFWTNGDDEHIVAPIVAANISVWPVPQNERPAKKEGMRLYELGLGDSAEVLSISPAIRGAQRRRLMDMGFLPGTKINVNLKSPSGDPTAYKVRGALIALRKEQATHITVRRLANEQAN